jgi:hypothetical protein
MMKNNRNNFSAPSSVTTKKTMITSIPSYKEWEKSVKIFRDEQSAEESEHAGLKLIVRDDITALIPQDKLNEEMKGKIGFYLALKDKKALNEARQSYLLSLQADLLAEARDLESRDKKAHGLRIRQIKGVFVYEPTPMYQLDPNTRELILDKSGQPIPIIGKDGQPLTRMSRVREEPVGNQREGRFKMLENGLVTEIITEQTEVLYPGLSEINEILLKVKKALEKEVGRPLKATLAERDGNLAAKFAELFGSK